MVGYRFNMAAMATKTKPKTPPRTPRIMVTLSPEARLLLKRMAELTGQRQASMVAELVDAGLPAISNALQVIELAKAGQTEQAELLMSRFAHAATAELAQEQLQLHQHLDGRTVKGKRVRRGASGRASP